MVSDVEAFVAGINAFNRKAKNGVKPWTYIDVTAVTGLLGQVFGSGGGNEVRSSMFLAELRNRFGAAGDGIWRDLRSADDPETPTTTGKRFPYATERGGSTPGSLVVDPGSLSASAARAADVLEASRRRASNAVLIARKRSATGHPLAVMGPQLGYYYPELFMEVDAHGGGIDVRGGVLPGIPYVLIGRGPRLRLERHVGQQRQRRPVPRGALQPGRDARHAQLHALHVQGRLPADEERSSPERCGHGQRAGEGRDLQGAGARAGERHGDRRREAVRGREHALLARARDDRRLHRLRPERGHPLAEGVPAGTRAASA